MNFQRMARFNIQYSGPAQIQLLHHTSYAICHMRFCKSDDDYDCDYDSIINYQIIDINK